MTARVLDKRESRRMFALGQIKQLLTEAHTDTRFAKKLLELARATSDEELPAFLEEVTDFASTEMAFAASMFNRTAALARTRRILELDLYEIRRMHPEDGVPVDPDIDYAVDADDLMQQAELDILEEERRRELLPLSYVSVAMPPDNPAQIVCAEGRCTI